MSREAAFLDVVSGRRTGFAAAASRGLLSLLTPAYAAAVRVRGMLYDHRWRETVRVDRPVISVGNLTAGGTGKTPVVAAIIDRLVRLGVRPGIASRGYKALEGAINDELLVLRMLCPGVPHRQNRNRSAAAGELVNRDGCDVVVLDDGFQHRRLIRDLDVVLIDATSPWGFGHLLPRGLMREPRSALRRAGLILITRSEQVTEDRLLSLRQEIATASSAPVLTTRFVPSGLRTPSGERRPIASVAGRKGFCFCGIGNPRAFRRTAESLDVRLDEKAMLEFPDHHAFNDTDLQRVATTARSRNAEVILCTLKDLVKLPRQLPDGPEILAVDIDLEIVEGRAAWERSLVEIAAAACEKSPQSSDSASA